MYLAIYRALQKQRSSGFDEKFEGNSEKNNLNQEV